jgi:hypothetical protein
VSEVILNTVPKKGEGKNLCSTRYLVAKLFVAILANKVAWGAEEYTKAGSILAYLFTDCAVGAGDHFVFSSSLMRRDGSSNAIVTSWWPCCPPITKRFTGLVMSGCRVTQR